MEKNLLGHYPPEEVKLRRRSFSFDKENAHAVPFTRIGHFLDVEISSFHLVRTNILSILEFYGMDFTILSTRKPYGNNFLHFADAGAAIAALLAGGSSLCKCMRRSKNGA